MTTTPLTHRPRRRTARWWGALGVAASLVAALGAGTATTASAAPVPPTGADAVRAAAVAHLVSEGSTVEEAGRQLDREAESRRIGAQLGRFGERVVDASIDDGGGLVVRVDDVEVGRQVEALGAEAVVVDGAQTARARAARDELVADLAAAGVAGTAVGVDVGTGEVVVEAPPTAVDTVRDLAGSGPVRVVETTGPATPSARLLGGDRIDSTNGFGACSAGYNLAGPDGSRYLLTAGHCSTASGRWAEEGELIGTTSTRNFGPGDYQLVPVEDTGRTNPSPSVRWGGQDGEEIDIYGVASPYTGMTVCKYGSFSGLSCGEITETGYSITYRICYYTYYCYSATVNDLVKSDACNVGGDSGGPLFTWDGYAVGIVSGKNNLGCGSPNTEGYYYPVENVLWEQSGNGIGLLTP